MVEVEVKVEFGADHYRIAIIGKTNFVGHAYALLSLRA